MTPELVLGVQDKITSWLPVPVRVTVCGLPLALSVMVSEAVRVPQPEGVNITAIVHWVPVASEAPHVLVSPKSLALVPVIVEPLIVKAALPVLVRVMVWEELVVATGSVPKVRLVAERLAAGQPVAVPESVTV